MDGNNVPGAAQGIVNGAINSLPISRRLGFLQKAACDAMVSSACSAAGVPPAVCNCFKKDLSSKCQSYISRRLGDKKDKKDKKMGKKDKKRSLGGCTGGYWPFHTRNTLKDPKFGPFDCLNGAVPCGEAKNATEAKKKLKAAWVKAGGKSYKYMADGYCPSQVSQSNIWKTGNIVWKFSKLKRRMGKKDKKSKKEEKKKIQKG